MLGSERRALEQVVGTNAFEQYRSFVDPLNMEPKRYSFMITGPVSPLTFTGNPILVDSYTSFDQFRTANDIGAPEVAPW